MESELKIRDSAHLLSPNQ